MSHMRNSPDNERFRLRLEMPAPTNLKSQKRVVGMFSYDRIFINNLSEKILVLNHNFEFPLPEHVLKGFSIFKR